MLSEVCQLLHITLVTSATAERTFSAMRRFENTRKKQTYTLYLMNLYVQMKEGEIFFGPPIYKNIKTLLVSHVIVS